jgi:hypothetical protein
MSMVVHRAPQTSSDQNSRDLITGIDIIGAIGREGVEGKVVTMPVTDAIMRTLESRGISFVDDKPKSVGQRLEGRPNVVRKTFLVLPSDIAKKVGDGDLSGLTKEELGVVAKLNHIRLVHEYERRMSDIDEDELPMLERNPDEADEEFMARRRKAYFGEPPEVVQQEGMSDEDFEDHKAAVMKNFLERRRGQLSRNYFIDVRDQRETQIKRMQDELDSLEEKLRKLPDERLTNPENERLIDTYMRQSDMIERQIEEVRKQPPRPGKELSLGEGYGEIMDALGGVPEREVRRIQTEFGKTKVRPKGIDVSAPMVVSKVEPELPSHVEAENAVQVAVKIPTKDPEQSLSFDLLAFNPKGRLQGWAQLWIRKPKKAEGEVSLTAPKEPEFDEQGREIEEPEKTENTEWYGLLTGHKSDLNRLSAGDLITKVTGSGRPKGARDPSFTAVLSKVERFLAPGGEKEFERPKVVTPKKPAKAPSKPTVPKVLKDFLENAPEDQAKVVMARLKKIKRLHMDTEQLRDRKRRLEEAIKKETISAEDEKAAKQRIKGIDNEIARANNAIDRLKKEIGRITGTLRMPQREKIEELQRRLEKAPEDAEAQKELAALKEKAGPEMARERIEALTRKLEEEPGNEEALEELVKLEDELGEAEKMLPGNYMITVEFMDMSGARRGTQSGGFRPIEFKNPKQENVGGELTEKYFTRDEMKENAEELVLNLDWLTSEKQKDTGWQNLKLRGTEKTKDGVWYQRIKVRVKNQSKYRWKESDPGYTRAVIDFTIPVNVKTGEKIPASELER